MSIELNIPNKSTGQSWTAEEMMQVINALRQLGLAVDGATTGLAGVVESDAFVPPIPPGEPPIKVAYFAKDGTYPNFPTGDGPLILTKPFNVISWNGIEAKAIGIDIGVDLSDYVSNEQKNAPNGVAALDENAELPGYVSVSQKGAAGGVTPLNQDLKTPIEYIPELPYADDVEFVPVKDYVDEMRPVILRTDVPGFVFALADSNGRLLGGWREDGSFQATKFLSNSITGAAIKDASIGYNKVDGSFQKYMLMPLSEDTGFKGGIFDNENRIILGIQQNGWLLFKSADVEKLKVFAGQCQDVIECDGDSLTMGAGGGGVTYPSVLQSLVGDKYNVVNLGVGGENVPTIAARIGGVPAVITSEFTLPGDGSEIDIATFDNRLKNAIYDGLISWLLQGTNSFINPVYVNDIRCTITKYGTDATNYRWSIKRVETGEDTVIQAGTPIFTNTVKMYRRPYLKIIFMGQNGGYNTPEELIDYIDRCIEFSRPQEFYIIGLHTNSAAYRAELEAKMFTRYGLRYFNSREYFTKYGLIDAGLTPTQADIDAMATGSCPPSLLSDGLHFNATGYTLLANKIYKRLIELGIINSK